jgi:hypothetical protein
MHQPLALLAGEAVPIQQALAMHNYPPLALYQEGAHAIREVTIAHGN